MSQQQKKPEKKQKTRGNGFTGKSNVPNINSPDLSDLIEKADEALAEERKAEEKRAAEAKQSAFNGFGRCGC